MHNSEFILHTSQRKPLQGFTLIELLIVIGVVLTFVTASSFIDMSAFRGNALRAEQARLVTLLQTARANALNNVDQKAHGVMISQNGYTLFEVNNPDSDPVFIPTQYPVAFGDETPTQVVFSQLSGNAIDVSGNPYDGDIVMEDPERGLTFTISINHEGRISW